jgi:uncharacterized protein YecT (DUF1311 family)
MKEEIMKNISASMITILVFVCLAFSQSQMEMNTVSCNKFKKADQKLNLIYKKILTEYKSDTIFTNKLIIAQKAWLVFRDAHLDAHYPDTSRMAYGSVNPMCRCIILEELTQKRIKELNTWLTGVEGDCCAGSIDFNKSK